jgi:superfamily II DNA or RNA helicase
MTAKEKKQAEIQSAARKTWDDGGQWGGLFMATGVGKSKIAVDIATELYYAARDGKKPIPSILLIVPTEKLRDDNWLEEFIKWNAAEPYNSLQRKCYASVNRLELGDYDLVIADEAHNLTEANSVFFEKNTVRRLIALSATPPDPRGNETDKGKVLLFKQFRIKSDFVYTLDQARADGIVSPYEITVVEATLDNTEKYIKAGNKDKPFMQTEAQAYEYQSRIIQKMMISKNDAVKWKSLARMRLIQNSIAKTAIAKKLIAKYGPGNRTIVFCGSIAQADELCKQHVYHSKSGDEYLNKFKREETQGLGVVEALNEGHNLPNVDLGIIVQLSSSAKDLIQRIGRLIRYRKGHTARVFIIVLVGTVDENWFKKAIASFDAKNITYIHAKNI